MENCISLFTLQICCAYTLLLKLGCALGVMLDRVFMVCPWQASVLVREACKNQVN